MSIFDLQNMRIMGNALRIMGTSLDIMGEFLKI